MNFSFLITFYVVDSNPASPFRLCLIPPAIAVENIMACWVFRNGKLGTYSTLRLPRQTLTADMFLVDSVFQTDAQQNCGRLAPDEETTTGNFETISMVQAMPCQPHIPQDHERK